MSDLEQDLKNSKLIVEKIKTSDNYAQNLYAALCNNQFIKEKEWSCSWRYAGGIISDIIHDETDCGNYLDWYCSGCWSGESEAYEKYLPEGFVSGEIEEDLNELGWKVL